MANDRVDPSLDDTVERNGHPVRLSDGQAGNWPQKCLVSLVQAMLLVNKLDKLLLQLQMVQLPFKTL